MILESRHVVGLFLLLVVIFGVVFTLGYLLGRSQYDTKLRADPGPPAGFDQASAATPPKAKARAGVEEAKVNPPEPAPENNWDYFHDSDPQATDNQLQPPKPSAAAASEPKQKEAPATKSAKSAKHGGTVGGPLIPRGAIMLQVAAVRRQDDALGLAQALQQKKFPAVVIPPASDKYYRVQVGPYRDNSSAARARTALEANGFKSIVKR